MSTQSKAGKIAVGWKADGGEDLSGERAGNAAGEIIVFRLLGTDAKLKYNC
ncbi:MAG: hypothetical protein QM530_02065 [Phycisphaerales bacterium]|nr:hypothetical protein [Phycisphaerales bacterium]